MLGAGVAPFVAHYGYLALFGALIIEGTGFPGPVELALLAAGLFVHEGRLSWPLVVLVATAGNLVGNLVGYAIGALGGRPLASAFMRLLHLPPLHLGRVEHWFRHYGGVTLIVSRFIGISRTPAILLAGVGKMGLASFLMWSLLADGLWSAFWVGVGSLFGRHVAVLVHHWIFLPVIGGGALALLWISRRRHWISLPTHSR